MKKKRKTEKTPRQKAIERLDSVFSKYVRLRDSDAFWIVVCPLCWRRWYRKEAQNMHFIKRWILKYRFDEINCHAWCKRCNVILDWNYMMYTRRMIQQYWMEKVDEMMFDKKPYKISTPELEELIKIYSEWVEYLKNRKHLCW